MNLQDYIKQLKPTHVEKTNIRVPKQIHKKLKLIATNENISIVKLTEFALNEFINNYEKQKDN